MNQKQKQAHEPRPIQYHPSVLSWAAYLERPANIYHRHLFVSVERLGRHDP